MADTQPLAGKRIVVTRARAQAAGLCARLKAYGATAIEFPTIRVAPMEDTRPLDRAIRRLETYDRVIFTSVNGVSIFWDRLVAAGRAALAFADVNVAAIGPATASALRQRGVKPAFVPDEFIAERIAEGLGDVAGQSILLPRAEIARQTLPRMLAEKGAQVDEIAAYRTLPVRPDARALAELRRGADVITFTSPSTVRHFVELVDGHAPALLQEALIACIGPVTARAAEEQGLAVDVIADEYTIDGLVGALVGVFREKQDVTRDA